MPGYTLTGRAQAPVEDVWKLLFDPSRLPEWWMGVETVRVDAEEEYTVWPDGMPDFPMPQSMRTDRANGRVVMSCQVLDIDFAWQLAEDGDHRDQVARVGRRGEGARPRREAPVPGRLRGCVGRAGGAGTAR
jgi:hypothetical protein